ncbi:DUF6893 family small protein [Streptomyces flaveolus]
MNKQLIGGAAAVVTATALTAFVAFWPDIRRYLRIRRM